MFNKTKLRNYLADENLSQEKLAEMLGCAQTYISAILIGRRQPSLQTTAALADIMGCTVDELIVKEMI